jgi:hypothetical protein
VALLEKARDALAAHNWALAFDLLSESRETSSLAAEDLDELAEAAWRTGRIDICIEALERAYQEFVGRGALGFSSNRRRSTCPRSSI